jgi:hypothetical protein
MYFDKLGTTEYNGVTIPDIFKRIVLTAQAQNSTLFEQYEIIEGETPESISYNYYNSVQFYWTIMTLNNIKSRYFDWPMSNQELSQYIMSKYGNKSALFFAESDLNNIVLCSTKYIAIDATDENKRWKVLECDRNLNKLVTEKLANEDFGEELQSTVPIFLLDQNFNIIKQLPASRIVYENEYSLYDVETRELLNQYVTGESSNSYVTNYDHEIQLNNQKRKIVLIRPEFVNTLVNEYKKLATS